VVPGRLDLTQIDTDLILDTLAYFLEYVIDKMFLPGQVENWVIIMDTEGLGVFSGTLSIIQKIMNFVQHNYRSRLYRMFVVNTPFSFYLLWRVVKTFLDTVSLKKLSFQSDGVITEMLTFVNENQLERKYGGNAPNLNHFWPPLAPYSKHYLTKSDDPTKVLIKDSEYMEMFRKGLLIRNKLSPFIVHRQMINPAQKIPSFKTPEKTFTPAVLDDDDNDIEEEPRTSISHKRNVERVTV
jgi:hypothetical protein